MRVLINAQLDPATSGGIAQVLLGLAHGLGNLEGGDEFVFVCGDKSAAWLESHMGGNSRIVLNTKGSTPAPKRGARESDGFFESFHPDVIHFPYQTYTKTEVPSVFNPHDLQHVHLADFFTQDERDRREALFADACGHAAAVTVASRFVKKDVVSQYGVADDKVHVIRWGSPTRAYKKPSAERVAKIRSKWALPDCFAIYPAQTWPHKNHKRLIEALALLRDQHSINLSLVCTGAETDFQNEIVEHVRQHGLSERVFMLGRVDEDDLMALYGAAEMMVVPTLFEAISFPIIEAFAEGVPVACSNVTALPEQVGDAAVVFDPHDIEQMASSMKMLHTDSDLREELVERGRIRLKQFTWQETAQAYREVYKLVAERVAQG